MTRQWRQRFAGFAVLSIFCIAIAYILRGPLLRVLAFGQRPLVNTGTWIAERTLSVCEGLKLAPAADASTLQTRIEVLAVDRAELERLQDENEELRSEIGFLERIRVRSIPANVVGRSGGEAAGTFLLDRGSKDGVHPGMPVVVGNGLLAGKITATTPTTSTAVVTSDPGMATGATLLNETRTVGLAEGTTNQLISMKYIPNDETVRVNDLVLTSGLEEGMVSGLVIGIVNDVRTETGAPFQEAVVEPLADMRRYTQVLILTEEQML